MKTEEELLAARDTLRAMADAAKTLGRPNEIAFRGGAKTLLWVLTADSTIEDWLDAPESVRSMLSAAKGGE